MKNKDSITNVEQENKTEYRLSTEERETHLWYDDIDKKWRAETSIRKHIGKFRRSGWDEVKTYKYKDGTDCIVTFEAPEFAISIRKPIKKVVSDERRVAMVENMKNYQNSKKLLEKNEG